jgi:hypothetical protein
MSLHNLNTPNKQWLMYLNTLSSISGNDLTIKPDTRRNLLLEVSANNNIFIKKGDISYNLTNYITGDVSFSNVDVSMNLNPLLPNNSNLGLPGKLWGNAYIRDISVTNISISGNMTISGTISNVIQIIPRLANDISSSLGSATNIWQRAFIRDLSNITSINGRTWPITVVPTGPVGPPGPAGSTGLGQTGPTGLTGPAGTTTTATWRDISNLTLTTNHRIYQNINRKPIYERNSNIQSWNWHRTNALSLGKSLASILNATQNEEIRLLISTETFIGGRRILNNTNNGTSLAWRWITGDPWNYTNWDTGEPGTTEEVVKMHLNGKWHDWPLNGFETHAVYMSYVEVEDPSWNAVIGYYGLAKDAYPSLNPLSSGELAVRTLTTRDIGANGAAAWNAICWSPELRIFVVGSYTGIGIMTSTNGINWTTSSVASGASKGTICWSPKLRLFVAVYWNGYAMTSNNGIIWNQGTTFGTAAWYGACWAPELEIFVAVGLVGTNNRVMTSRDGLNWTRGTNIPQSDWISVVWSPELRIFVAVSVGSTANFAMTSSDGIYWTMITNALFNYAWKGLCWSPQLGIFVAIANLNRVMTSNNGINWNIYTSGPPSGSETSLSWSPQLKLFFSTSNSGTIATSSNGINWTTRTSTGTGYRCSCWSPELGIFVSPSINGYVLTSSLKGRPPTSYNVFDSSFNRINENGRWDFSNINVTALTVDNVSVVSDDRLKHNEIVIANGLNIIDRLTPKFYQKTQVLLDASYNGDLSAYSWSHEAGLIAQEVLQISDISYVVGGGDYYEQTYNLITQTQDLSANCFEPSNNYYEVSNNYYEPSANNYEISYNLIAQAYNLNYNSVFVYGLAAIKELHTKVKAQESTILNQKNIISSLLARIQALEK